jgi:hypothetical protein
MILQASDKSNANLNRRLMGAFREVVRDLALKDLNLRGRKFTWSNNDTQPRIDWAFCTASWDLMLPNVHLQALSSKVSDHCPLLIAKPTTVNKYRRFHLEAFWPKLPGFLEVVQIAWSKEVLVVNPFLRLHIQQTSKALRQWARRLIGNNKVLLCAAAKLIGILDVVQEFRHLSISEIQLRKDLKARFLGLTAVEKLRAKQSSRMSSIRAAEANERLFYLQANGHRRKNLIHSLQTPSGTKFAHEEKELALFEHFSGYFGRPPSREFTLNWEELNLPRHDLSHLEEVFTEESARCGPGHCSRQTACSVGWWLVMVCSERRVMLAGCWWLVCCERKILLAGG